MTNRSIHRVMRLLEAAARAWKAPVVSAYAEARHPPFQLLISTLLSLRTKDAVTGAASERLFALARSPAAMVRLSTERIERAIYPVGFYRTKARTIREVCRALLERFDGQVPNNLDALLSLKGVGRKTANLVLTLGFQSAGICVDTHVHRICNRWGYVATKTPEQTEAALRQKLPRQYWIPLNDLLVTYGQNLCTPLSPHCSRCPLAFACRRVAVSRSR
ncbi:MAG: endonuclease III [Candidatus Tectomicrobia bacterium]|nr:endonuclease III [Candidatus Tectomicrobia bacterium]